MLLLTISVTFSQGRKGLQPCKIYKFAPNCEKQRNCHARPKPGFFFFFNWRIFDLQCCLGFCHTARWISHMYTYSPSLLDIPLLPCPHSIHLGHRVESWVPCTIQWVQIGCLLHLTAYIRRFQSPKSSKPLQCPHIHSLHLLLYSSPTNRFTCTIF